MIALSTFTRSVGDSVLDRVSAVVRSPSVGVLIGLAALCAYLSSRSPSFMSLDNWTNISNQMVYVLLLALGMTVVLVTGGIDLSVGSVMGLTAGVVAYLMVNGVSLPVALALAVLCGAGLGLVNGLMITVLGLPDFIATLAMLGLARGLLFLWTNGIPFIAYMTPDYYTVGGLEPLWGRLTVPLVVALVALLLVSLLLRRTAWGRHSFGVGSNVESARLSGVRVNRIKVLAYVLSGTLAGVAGVLLAGRTTTVAPTTGVGYEVQAIAAAVIGGAALAGGQGRAIGALIGALTLAITSNAINITGVSSSWQQVVTGSVLLLAVVFDRVTTLVREHSLVRSQIRAQASDPVRPEPPAEPDVDRFDVLRPSTPLTRR